MIWLAQALFFLALGGLVAVRLRTLLTYFQQEEYDNRRFLTAWREVQLYDLRASAAVILGVMLIMAGVPQGLGLLAMAGVLTGIGALEYRYRFKKPLALTERARRIYALAAVLLALPVLASVLWPLAALIALQAGPLALIVANAALKPLQERINDGYVTEARAKLARMDPVRIGITGSFGKTTVKHILAEVLEAAGPVFYSRGSINTVLGLTRHIRQRLQWAHRYFIAEMGAYGIGSIKRLCDFAEPTYGIVTAVGDAHTERFGSIENIARAKSELVEEVCKRGGTAVINADVMKWAPFQRLKESHGAQVITVGPEGADVEVRAQALSGGVWRITLIWTDGRLPDTMFELPLLGDHNVMNAALAVTLTLVIDPTLANQIPFFTKTVSQIPHRLQKVEMQGAALVLDDAYNANELGFKSAVATLGDLSKDRGGRAILVTPGIAELGLEHDAVHARLGALCNEFCDVVYAVNPSRIPTFTAALDRARLSVIEVPSFFEARRRITADMRAEDVILYENDLPDLLEEKRLL